MDVVPDTSSVRSRVITSKDAQMSSFPHDDLLDVGEQVIGMNKRFISEEIALVSTTRVEVS